MYYSISRNDNENKDNNNLEIEKNNQIYYT